MATAPHRTAPPASAPSGIPGVEHEGTLADHEARAALRALVVLAFEAIDVGEHATFRSCFTSTGRWTPPADLGTADDDPGARLEQWRRRQPWSVHWLTNEEVHVDGGQAVGTWLWSAASVGGDGDPVWSGGDVTLRARLDATGWRIDELAVSDRYRTSWTRGWLEEPHRPLPAAAADPAAPGGPGQLEASSASSVSAHLLEPVATSMSAERRAAALAAGVRVRNLVADFVGALEVGAVDRARGLLAPTARLRDAAGGEVTGEELAAALLVDSARGAGLMRTLCSWWCDADGVGRATAGWRELATTVVEGRATWTATAWTAEAVEDAGGWQLLHLSRRELLSTPYLPPWSVGSTEVVS